MRRPEREQPAFDDDLASAYATCITPSRDASAREQVERFEAAYRRLGKTDREVIALARVAGLPHAEVAAQLNITPEGSRTLLRRALIRLSALMHAAST
jgi:RNA polymerase sigma factor (sigma-70 family)